MISESKAVAGQLKIQDISTFVFGLKALNSIHERNMDGITHSMQTKENKLV